LARYKEAVCKLCRREGVKLYLKGNKCYGGKCIIDARPNPPGEHGHRRRKLMGYGLQLREKQKVKRLYGALEKQFRLTFQRAERQKGITGENLLSFLERRLDNVVFRLGYASSRRQARQIVRHNHILVNDNKANIPSMLVEAGDVITVKEKSRANIQIKDSLKRTSTRGVPDWLELNKEEFSGKVIRMPVREDITDPISEQLIVELYSK
jgi:small subunit ribosomal protein S4